MFTIKKSKLDGCVELYPRLFNDERGKFVKVFHKDEFAANGLETNFAEEYYSTSHKSVIRGLHFQQPPLDHVKLVYCVAGQVIDAVVDLRRDSPTYGHHALFELSESSANAIYIPKGMAHGFCVISDQATLVYKVSTVYSAHHDAGIRWDSAGIQWPVDRPILSSRDKALPRLCEFHTPF